MGKELFVELARTLVMRPKGSLGEQFCQSSQMNKKYLINIVAGLYKTINYTYGS